MQVKNNARCRNVVGTGNGEPDPIQCCLRLYIYEKTMKPTQKHVLYGLILFLLFTAPTLYFVGGFFVDWYMETHFYEYTIQGLNQRYIADGQLVITSGRVVSVSSSYIILEDVESMAAYTEDQLLNCKPALGQMVQVAGYYQPDKLLVNDLGLPAQQFQIRRVLEGC